MIRDLVQFLDEYLEIDKFEDSSWNGLQVEGKREVKKVAFSVTAGVAPFEKAKEAGADMIVVHHGLFWSNANPSLRGWLKDRVTFLVKNELSLYAAHLPLDAHPEVGNNAQLSKLFGIKEGEPFASSIGIIGEHQKRSLGEIVSLLEREIGAECKVLDFGNREISRTAIVSGGAPYKLFEAIERGADLFLTGDPTDILEVARDAKINVVFAGHYATETVGVKALSDLVKDRFGVEVIFIDSPTGL